jgi:hypothetical protein
LVENSTIHVTGYNVVLKVVCHVFHACEKCTIVEFYCCRSVSRLAQSEREDIRCAQRSATRCVDRLTERERTGLEIQFDSLARTSHARERGCIWSAPIEKVAGPGCRRSMRARRTSKARALQEKDRSNHEVK